MALVLIVLIALAAVWIARWDLRRPDALEARARNPFARPRPSLRRLAILFVAAIAVCLLALEFLPALDRYRFP